MGDELSVSLRFERRDSLPPFATFVKQLDTQKVEGRALSMDDRELIPARGVVGRLVLPAHTPARLDSRASEMQRLFAHRTIDGIEGFHEDSGLLLGCVVAE